MSVQSRFATVATPVLAVVSLFGVTYAEAAPVVFNFDGAAALAAPNPATQGDLFGNAVSADLVLTDGSFTVSLNFTPVASPNANSAAALNVSNAGAGSGALGVAGVGSTQSLNDGEAIIITPDIAIQINALLFQGLTGTETITLTTSGGITPIVVANGGSDGVGDDNYQPLVALELEAGETLTLTSSAGSTSFFNGFEITLVPEPSSMSLAMMGAGLALVRRRHKA